MIGWFQVCRSIKGLSQTDTDVSRQDGVPWEGDGRQENTGCRGRDRDFSKSVRSGEKNENHAETGMV